MRLQLLSLLIISIFLTQAASSATYPDINPCSLISPQKIYTAYPTIKTMEEQTIGPNTTCNYHNKYGLSELIVSVHKNDGAAAKSVVSMLGDGYRIKTVEGLGKEAAMAISLPKPEYGIAGDQVAELYIKEADFCLMLAPVRLNIKGSGPGFETFREIVLEMLGSSNLP